jgi:hypothetical protein
MTDTIKTWQERLGLSSDTKLSDLEYSPECAMQEEIDELRAALAQQAEQVPAERRTLYECRSCGLLYSEKVFSCDCMENGANEYNEWAAAPKGAV